MKKFSTVMFTLLTILSMLGACVENTRAVPTDGPSGEYYIQYAYNQEGSNRYVYIWKLCYAGGDPEKVGQKVADPGEMDWSEGRIYEAIAFYNYLTYDYLVEFLNDGFMTEYIDEFIIVGRLPEGFTLNTASSDNKTEENPAQEQDKPEPESSQKPSDTNKNDDTSSANKEQPSTQIPSVETEPILNTECAGTYVVADNETKSYSTYKADVELKTWTIGTQIQVEGLLSNGYYKALAENTSHYIDKCHLVPLAEYEKAWVESSKVESECEKSGSVTYTNVISNETKTEETEALEHDYKEVETIEASCETEGHVKSECIFCNKEIVETLDAQGHVFNGFSCKVCGEISFSRILATLGVVGICVVVATFVVYKKAKNKGSRNVSKGV